MLISLLAALALHAPAQAAQPQTDWLRLPPARFHLAAEGLDPHPMAWASVGAVVGGALIPSVGNTVYLFDRNGPSWESAQQAIDEPLLLLWANTWLFGAVGPVACSTSMLVLYLGADGPASQAFGGWIIGTFTGIAALPVGVLLGTGAVRPFKDVLWGPGWVYGTYSAVSFSVMALGGLVGFNLGGARLPEAHHLHAGPTLLSGDGGALSGWAVSGRF